MWKRDHSVTPAGSRRDSPAQPAPFDDAQTLVMDLGKSLVIKGELSGSEDFTVYGQMEGSIRLPDHTLTIGPNADIKAHIFARAVLIMGAVTGDVRAKERIEIRATGSVTGDLESPRLVIADGGHLVGRVSMSWMQGVKSAD